MKIEDQLAYLNRNYECVCIRYINTRSKYRLHMGSFDPNKFLEARPFIGLDEYWTMEASSSDIAIASAFHEIKRALQVRCGLA